MMQLELRTNNLDVRFGCTEEYANDLEILDAIRDLVFKLENHENVNLSIVSRPEEHSIEDHEDYNEEFPEKD